MVHRARSEQNGNGQSGQREGEELFHELAKNRYAL
jgi:hypothetical protein